MRILNPIAFAILAISVSSCGTQKGIVATNPENVDKFPLKTTALKEEQLKRWSHLDLVKDTVPGMSVDLAYAKLLANKKGNTITVAVIDSGIDIEHEDLKSSIWKNPKEIPNNKIDEDKNGYVDDVHGWNFLGNSHNETLEMTRIVKKGDDGSETYKKAYEKLTSKKQELEGEKQQLDFILNTEQSIKKHLNKDNYTLEEVKAIETTDPNLLQSKQIFIQVLSNTSKEDFDKEMNEFKKHVYDQLNYNLNTDFDGRKVLGDNHEDFNSKFYGNNDVIGPDREGAKHGTHVAGIIAQTRNNKLGGDGIASNNVKIMAIRAVPNGDEYDKDIALAIRYAVDNGAKVINGSFGKSFSPQKQWVFDAIKYAASKDVLFVHAAGNDAENIDIESNFPNDADGSSPEFADNVLTVGALNYEYGVSLMANFSNFGKKNVDVFAPGVKIYATTPNNKYEYLAGTSMASPNAAGVAALIRSYYPTLTASQVKHILMDSGTALTNPIKLAGDDNSQTTLTAISKSGRIVNAYNALLLAEKMALKK